ncbi:hypothetical protein K9L97_05525 [Candidatus Woesearchaeota archaeon]|nr:hypothetical protein [Candidatus Woesearchaeota archaeon]
MKDKFKEHYIKFRPIIKKRLLEFSEFRRKGTKELFEEMAFCVFAANSSAEMANTALNLLKPVLWSGTLKDYKKKVHKKVRFYNVRSKYLHENRLIIENFEKQKIDFKKHLESLEYKERREFIRKNFKGFGMKEASHFLRNIGYEGYTIIDKHVLNMMHDMDVIKSNSAPKTPDEYYKIEKKIIDFAEKEGYDIDELDLALWSFKAGKVMR